MISERAGTREVNDSEFEADPDDDVDGHTSDPAIEISSDEAPEVLATIKRANPNPNPNSGRKATTGVALMQKIADNFAPSAQRQRDHQRAEQSLSSIHILTLSQQLRDSQKSESTLRSEITQLYNRLHAAESARERLELKWELLGGRAIMRRPGAGACSQPKRRHTRHHEPVTRTDGHISMVSMTDTDSPSSSDGDKENADHCQRYPRPLMRARPFPMDLHNQNNPKRLKRAPLQELSPNQVSSHSLSATLPTSGCAMDTGDTDVDLPPVATAYDDLLSAKSTLTKL